MTGSSDLRCHGTIRGRSSVDIANHVSDPKDVRQGERARTWVRSGRLVELDAGWYIRTREGEAIGPYASELDAQISAAILIARLQQKGTKVDDILTEFLLDPAHGPRPLRRRSRGS